MPHDIQKPHKNYDKIEMDLLKEMLHVSDIKIVK